MHRQPPAAEMIQRRQLARGQRRRHKPRPMRQHQGQFPGHDRRDVAGKLVAKRVGSGIFG